MSATNIASVEKFEILPSNQPADNTYSFRKGNPIITFNIGSTSKLLRASSVRVNGTLTVFDATGALLGNGDIVQSRGSGGGATTGKVKINPRVGVNGLFQNVSIASNDTNQTLESVRQYGRMCATVFPSTHSTEDFLQSKGVVELNTGLEGVTGDLINNSVSFSCQLLAGMLQSGTAIPMGVNGVRGLTLQLELVSDQQLLSGADAGSGGGAFYEIKDLSITGDFLVPDAQGQQALSVAGSGAFQYNSYNNLYSVIDSGDATQTYNLASSGVLDIFHNFLPVSHANNYGQDGFSTSMLQTTNASGSTYTGTAVLQKVSFSRGGLKLGLDYDLDVQTQSEQGRPETGVIVNALNAVGMTTYGQKTKLVNQPLLLNFGGKDEVIYNDSGLQSFSSVDDGKRNFAIGLGIDKVSGVGVDFRGQSYATRIQSTLDGKSPNAVYTYVLSKNTLMYAPTGIMVQS